MVKLDTQVEMILRSAWAESTLKTRNSQWKRFIEFCLSNDLVAVPSEVTTVARFLVSLAKNCCYTTCNNYLSAVVTLHKFFGYDYSFRECFVIKLVMQGLACYLGKGVNQKAGLTPEQFMRIYDLLDFSNLNTITKWAAIMLSFRSLLRKSNILPTKVNEMSMVISRGDIEIVPTGVVLNVRKTKTLQCNEYTLRIPINFLSNKKLCAASMLITHLMRTPHIKEGLLFLEFKNGQWKPLMYSDLLKFIKDCAALIGLSPSSVGLHSLRRSGAAFLHSIGISLIDIMNAGDWHSLAALAYLVSPFDRKHQIESVAAKALDDL